MGTGRVGLSAWGNVSQLAKKTPLRHANGMSFVLGLHTRFNMLRRNPLAALLFLVSLAAAFHGPDRTRVRMPSPIANASAPSSSLDIVIQDDRAGCSCLAKVTEVPGSTTTTACCAPAPFLYVTTPDIEDGKCQRVEGVCKDADGACTVTVKVELKYPGGSSNCGTGGVAGPGIGTSTIPCQGSAPGTQGAPPQVTWKLVAKCKSTETDSGDGASPMLFWCSGCDGGGAVPSTTTPNLKFAPKLICGACK
jgi:hypothetical protein